MEPVAYFASWELTPTDRAYLRFHRLRYALLIREVAAALPPSADRAPTILDVAPLMQTELLRCAFPEATVNSLGFGQPGRGWGPGRDGTAHWHLDLNDCDRDEAWPEVPVHDVLVMAEVLEHLHVAPEIVLRRLSPALRHQGHMVIQTPNAAPLPKRIALLGGRNPYQRLQPLRWNPGHIREYTREELSEIAAATGFVVESVVAQNYFEPDSAKYRAYNKAAAWLPPSFRDGITIRLRKEADP